MFCWRHTLSSKTTTWNSFQAHTALQLQVYRQLHWRRPMKSWGKKKESHNNKLQFSTDNGMFVQCFGLIGKALDKKQADSCDHWVYKPSWSSLFLTLNPHLASKISCSLTQHIIKLKLIGWLNLLQNYTLQSRGWIIHGNITCYTWKRSQLLYSLLFCIHRGTCLFSFGPFSALQISVQEPPRPGEGMHTSQNQYIQGALSMWGSAFLPGCILVFSAAFSMAWLICLRNFHSFENMAYNSRKTFSVNKI